MKKVILAWIVVLALLSLEIKANITRHDHDDDDHDNGGCRFLFFND